MDCDSLNILSLCSGYGGLDLGVELATGGSSRVVCHVEREAFAACILAARMADQTMAEAPVWSDLRNFDGKPWRGVVDCITGGYPCQPFSFAGRRAGENDPRHLWPDIARIVGEVEPGIVFFENVGGHLSLGFESVRDELQGMGYRVAAGLFSAAEVGAPHRRERLFILAHREGGGFVELRPASGGDGRTEQNGGALVNPSHFGHQRDGWGRSADAGGELADAHGDGREGCGIGEREHGEPGQSNEGLADTRSQRPQGECRGGSTAGAVGRSERAEVGNASGSDGQRNAREVLGAEAGISCERQHDGRFPLGPEHADTGVDVPIFPPGPGSRAEWERILRIRPDLAPATQPRVRGVDDGTASRLDRLRACGNGVVPLAAAYAFVSLWACLTD